MDPLTHSLVGGLAAKTVGASKRRFWIMMLLGVAPDLDVLANGAGGWASSLEHRGLTHSFLGIFLQVFFYAWLLRKWDSGKFGVRAFHYSLPLFLHLLCDYLTSYGVPLWAPFSFKEYSADLVVNLSLVPIFFMGTSLLWLYREELSGWKKTRVVWMTWALYLTLFFSGKAYATKIIDANETKVVTLPTVVNPLEWRAVQADPKRHIYRQYEIDLLKGKDGL